MFAAALAKEKRPIIRLAACSLLTHLARSGLPGSLTGIGGAVSSSSRCYAGGAGEGEDKPNDASSSSAGDSSLRVAVLPTLMKLLGEAEVREAVPRVLSRLVEDREELQKLAADADAINKLAAFLHDDNCRFLYCLLPLPHAPCCLPGGAGVIEALLQSALKAILRTPVLWLR